MNTFTTKTNEKKTAKRNAVTFVILTVIPFLLVAAYCLQEDPPAWDLLGICSACFALIWLVLAFQIRTNNIFTLRFEGAVLYLDGKQKRAHYQVYDIPASDIVLRQSKADKAANRCSLRIKHTIFDLKYVENYSELKKYIKANYPKK